MTELKPCPFCGGEAEFHTDKGVTGELYGWVGCNQCDAMSGHCDIRSMQPEEDHPVVAWNRRTLPTLPDDLEGLCERARGMIIQDVCELPDYTSPDDQPDLLQCTVEELTIIVDREHEPLAAAIRTLSAELAAMKALIGEAVGVIERHTYDLSPVRRTLAKLRSAQ